MALPFFTPDSFNRFINPIINVLIADDNSIVREGLKPIVAEALDILVRVEWITVSKY